MKKKTVLWVLMAMLLTPAFSEARITKIMITSIQSPTFGALSFGTVGQYEKLRGTAFGELDPADPRNAVIVDLGLAPRNAGGKVEYSMDIFILKPIVLSNGNHRLFIDFNNRGQMRLGTLNGGIQPGAIDRKSTRLNSSHIQKSRMPSSA